MGDQLSSLAPKKDAETRKTLVTTNKVSVSVGACLLHEGHVHVRYVQSPIVLPCTGPEMS